MNQCPSLDDDFKTKEKIVQRQIKQGEKKTFIMLEDDKSNSFVKMCIIYFF